MSNNKKNFVCSQCDPEKFFARVESAIEHCRKQHPDTPERCDDQFGRTWDGTLTRLCGELIHERANNMKLSKEHALVTAQRNEYIAKLNAIIMILNGKS